MLIKNPFRYEEQKGKEKEPHESCQKPQNVYPIRVYRMKTSCGHWEIQLSATPQHVN